MHSWSGAGPWRARRAPRLGRHPTLHPSFSRIRAEQPGPFDLPLANPVNLAGDERRLAGTARAHPGTFSGSRSGLGGAGSRCGSGSASRSGSTGAGCWSGSSIGSTMIVRERPGSVMWSVSAVTRQI